MTDNIDVRDSLGVQTKFRTTETGGVHLPHHKLDTGRLAAGPAGLVTLNTDLLTGTVDGWFDVGDYASASIQIFTSAGDTSGNLIFEQTNSTGVAAGLTLFAMEVNNQATNPLSGGFNTAAASNRAWFVALAMKYIRVRISLAPTGGKSYQANIFLSTLPVNSLITTSQQAVPSWFKVENHPATTVLWPESVTPLAANAAFTYPTRDSGALSSTPQRYAGYEVGAVSNVAGLFRIEGSNDNSNWYRASPDVTVPANTPTYQAVPLMMRYYRTVYTNGATIQTSFMLNSRFTH